MSDFYPIQDEQPRPRPPPKVYPTQVYDITNPSPRLKFLYPLATAGSPTHCIGIEPGQKLTGVRVADHVVAQLREVGDELVFAPAAPKAMGDVVKAIPPPLGAGDVARVIT